MFRNSPFTNARPEISVNVVKKSKHDDVTLEGATFGLYAEEDLTAADGKDVYKRQSKGRGYHHSKREHTPTGKQSPGYPKRDLRLIARCV